MPTRTSASLSSLEDSRFLLQEQRIRVRSACARTAEALRQHEAAEAFEAQHRSLVNRLDNVIDSDNDAVEDLLVNYERRLQVAQVRAEEARENDQDLRQSELRQLRVRDEQAAEKAAYAMEQEKDGQKSRLRASQRRVADTKERFAELTRDEWQRERAFLHSYNYKRKTILERFNTADEAKQLSQLDKELKFHLFDVHLKTEGIKFQQSAALEKILAARMVEEEASTARQAAIEAQAGKKRAALKEERRLSAVRAKLRCIALQEKAEHSIRLIQQDHESAVASLTYKIHQANLKRKRQFDILEADRIQGQETRLQREAKIAAVEKSALEELAQARSRQTQKAHHRRHSEPPPHSESTSESRKRQKHHSMPSEKTKRQSHSSSPPPDGAKTRPGTPHPNGTAQANRRSTQVDIASAWAAYNCSWTRLLDSSLSAPLRWNDIPWPVLDPRQPSDITLANMRVFLFSEQHSMVVTQKERARAALLRWHPDRFEGRWLESCAEQEREAIKASVGDVARALNELWSQC